MPEIPAPEHVLHSLRPRLAAALYGARMGDAADPRLF
jgi:hypothetical protein